MKCSLGISNFLEEISSLSHSIDFLYFFALITEEGFISPCYSLELCIQMGICFLFALLFTSLLFTAICMALSVSVLFYCISFSWGWSWSLSRVQCHEPPSIVHQALCHSKFFKPGFNSMWIVNLQMFKLVLEKAEELEIKLPTSAGSSKKQENSRKTSISALLTMPTPLTVWITTNCGKFWKRW